MSTPRRPSFPEAARAWLHRQARRLALAAPTPLHPEEAMAIADLAMVEAWQRFDPGRGLAFSTFARKAVLGAVRRALQRHGRASRAHVLGASVDTAAPGPAPDVVHAARTVASDLDPLDFSILSRHAVAEESLDAIAAALALPKTTVWRRLGAAKARARRLVATAC